MGVDGRGMWMTGRKQTALQGTFMCFPSCIITHPKAKWILHKHYSKYLPRLFRGGEGRRRDEMQNGQVNIKHQCPCSPNEETRTERLYDRRLFM